MAAIHVHNRQRKIRIDLASLQEFADSALTNADRLGITPTSKQIDVMLISDSRMSELHQRFLKMRGPTDVITFQHGEIFISVETARRQARELGTSAIAEVELYLVHGLLHLSGFDDSRAADARAMRRMQERIANAARKKEQKRRTSAFNR